MKKLVVSMVSIGLLAACGGGGGSSLVRLPPSITVNVYEGETPQVRVKGYATREPRVYPSVEVTVDGTYFDASGSEPYVDSEDMSMTVTLELLPLDASTTPYSTQIQAVICEEEDCETHVIPVTINVAADPQNPTTPPNGDFSAGTTGWTPFTMNGAIASLAVTDGALRVAVTQGGSNMYSVQVSAAAGINLENGKTYLFSFDAHASSTKTIRASVDEGRDRDGDGTGTIYTQSLHELTLTTSAQTFTSSFTMTETNRAAGVSFFVGGAGDVYIDNISVTEVLPD